ncbi:hypothetical protein [Acinetobacter sp. YH16044]|uniref:hypothetical protein n=1 Tax=Acinetobacter sp. YH16044 TaxID=2601187 RepID=UPI0015D2A45E|nr:hypothetical protein [Acinetobacter sp. YH16044]
MNLNTYLQQLDLAKLDLQPLNDHFIAERLNEQEKELYLTMISSFILLDELTEPRTRLFQLYLHACKTEHQQGKIFNLAQNISKDQIKEFIQLCSTQDLVKSFLIDAFIFLRLDRPLNDQKNILLNEWISLFELKESDLTQILYVVCQILGIQHSYEIHSTFSLDHANLWKEYLLQELTKDKLKQGISQGFWIVKQTIDINFNCQISNANLYFENDSILKFNEGVKVEFIKSNFENPLFNFYKVDHLKIHECKVIGQYDSEKKLTVLKINQFEDNDSFCEIKKCYFETHNSQTLSVINKYNSLFFLRTGNRNKKKLFIEKCTFDKCGNEKLVGGALFLKNINFKVKKTDIFNCKALVSGGIYTSDLYQDSLEEVHFKNCLSCLYQDSTSLKKLNEIGFNGSGILIEDRESYSSGEFIRLIKGCTFEKSNLFIACYSSGRTFERCNFIDSILGLKDYYDQDHETKPCEFLVINKEIESGFKYLPNFKFDPLHEKTLEFQLADLNS